MIYVCRAQKYFPVPWNPCGIVLRMEQTVPAQKMDSVVRLWVESKLDSTALTEVQIPHDFYDRETSWVTDEKYEKLELYCDLKS